MSRGISPPHITLRTVFGAVVVLIVFLFGAALFAANLRDVLGAVAFAVIGLAFLIETFRISAKMNSKSLKII